MNTVKENLIKAKALIADPENWCKGYCQPMDRFSADTAAYKVCESEDEFSDVLDELIMVLEFGQRDVAKFNDRPDTNHSDVMALFERAIAAQE